MITAVDRATRCIVSWAVERTRTWEVLQGVVDQAVRARQYFSDGLAAYADVYYHGASYQAVLDKSQTYAVEGDNAELRHYLARLHRSTRCYSKCIAALRGAIALLVQAWNRRQLHNHAQPNYPANLIDFISVRV